MTTQSSTWHSEPAGPPSPNQRAVPGTIIGGRYQLRVAIGHGGMGTVWHAADTVLHRDVAVKEVLLPPGIAVSDRTALYERTMREARAAAALAHPSVVQVYDVVTEGDRPWIIMELLHARSLADMIISDGPLAPRAVAKIGVALLGALEVAHGAGVLHRDVKPANVLICTDGRCVLTDFGVARLPSESTLTTPGMVLGSPHFISPERAVGSAFGPPSDLFSLGVSLYTAIEGRPPFDRGDPFETMRAVVEDPPAPPVRSGALAPVLYGLLEKDPNRRWDVPRARQSLRDLLDGPLANQSAHHVTDPYTVVPVPHQPPLTAPVPTGQVGGRALLPPAAAMDVTAPIPGARGGGRAGPAGPVLEPTSPGMPPVPAHTASPGLLADLGRNARLASHRARITADGMVGQIRRWPRRTRLIAAGAAAAAVLVVIALAAGAFSGSPPAPHHPSVAASTAANAPLITNPQVYQDQRGFSLNVPGNWKQRKSGAYIDFTDPNDPGRRLRINVESAGGTAEQFLLAAETQLRKHPDKCATPYQRVALHTDVTLSGRPAAELEYTCGAGSQQRHGLWRATVTSRKAYEFYLSVETSHWQDSVVVYQEAARSYQFTG